MPAKKEVAKEDYSEAFEASYEEYVNLVLESLELAKNAIEEMERGDKDKDLIDKLNTKIAMFKDPSAKDIFMKEVNSRMKSLNIPSKDWGNYMKFLEIDRHVRNSAEYAFSALDAVVERILDTPAEKH